MSNVKFVEFRRVDTRSFHVDEITTEKVLYSTNRIHISLFTASTADLTEARIYLSASSANRKRGIKNSTVLSLPSLHREENSSSRSLVDLRGVPSGQWFFRVQRARESSLIDFSGFVSFVDVLKLKYYLYSE